MMPLERGVLKTMATVFCIVILMWCVSILIHNHGDDQSCTRMINQCSRSYWCGKAMCTEYVSCTDTQAEYIEQVCITHASDEALNDFYDEKVQP